eukprot:2830085-Amphidinium_carterae.1
MPIYEPHVMSEEISMFSAASLAISERRGMPRSSARALVCKARTFTCQSNNCTGTTTQASHIGVTTPLVDLRSTPSPA